MEQHFTRRLGRGGSSAASSRKHSVDSRRGGFSAARAIVHLVAYNPWLARIVVAKLVLDPSGAYMWGSFFVFVREPLVSVFSTLFFVLIRPSGVAH